MPFTPCFGRKAPKGLNYLVSFHVRTQYARVGSLSEATAVFVEQIVSAIEGVA